MRRLPARWRVIGGIALASLVATLAAQPAWGHTFPAARHIVLQVEPCELVMLVGYRPRSGEPTETILSRAASAPKSQTLGALRDVLAAFAMAPLTITLDGRPLVPTNVRAKIGIEPGGGRPMVVLLVTYPIGAGQALEVRTKDPRSTRISWQDRRSDRVTISAAPAQGKWHAGVASFLLSLSPSWGSSVCAAPSSHSDSSPVP